MIVRHLLLSLMAGAFALGAPVRVGVTIHVAVTDNAGRPVTDLATDEVEVLAAGRPVPADISLLTPEHSTLVVLIDATDSVPFPPLLLHDGLQQAIAEGVQHTHSPGSRVLIHGIAGPFATAALPATFEVKHVAEQLRSINELASEPSPLWDATIRSIETAREGDTNALALLLLTDGRATGNRCGVLDAVRVALQRGASISAISLGGPSIVAYQAENMVVVDPSRILRQATDTTGGLFISSLLGRAPASPPGRNAREAVVTRAARTIAHWAEYARMRYRVHLDLPPSATAQSLSVRVRRAGVTVHAPSSYLTSGGQGRCLAGG